MSQKKILVPLPSYGFDPTEVAIPWKLLSQKGIEFTFISPQGNKAISDRLMLKGERLGIWKSLLRARKDAVEAYYEMEKTEAFCQPKKYEEVAEKDFDALLLPGGHDKGVKEYLESKILQDLVVAFFNAKKPVAAICHGVVLIARSINPDTGKSVIHNYKTTSLLKLQELTGYNLTRLWLKDYYLTYPGITVEEEVKSVLSNKKNFFKGNTPVSKDDFEHLDRGFTCRDRNYLSARWTGDVYNFSLDFIKMIQE